MVVDAAATTSTQHDSTRSRCRFDLFATFRYPPPSQTSQAHPAQLSERFTPLRSRDRQRLLAQLPFNAFRCRPFAELAAATV
ncbi:hypothetical protein [Pelagicoccus mobilis]|uniref:Uncharacterized protein n=1 Tax=Pelagicoccus mobilis TaxID=415221 RepID=A0A934RYI0_9BACT|nr:hypothetical protein [Pelagicoccus mobilis]MBK1877589.1 hypothetical protein [Pelagicoccus mobilis]